MFVHLLQLDIAWEDKPANHQRVRALLERTPIVPQSLVILPEMFDTGFSMQLSATAQAETRESEQFLRDIAREYDVAVLAGVVGPLQGGQASNEAVAFAPDGRELVRYRKQRPFTPAGEDQHYGAGDRHRIFTWNGMKIAPFICYDLRFPELFRPAAGDGAEVLVVVACWPATRSEHWVRLLQARAIENQAFAIGVNRCGADPGLRYDGRSCVFDPLGSPLCEATDQEQVLSLAIDPELVRGWRAQFPALRDMRCYS